MKPKYTRTTAAVSVQATRARSRARACRRPSGASMSGGGRSSSRATAGWVSSPPGAVKRFWYDFARMHENSNGAPRSWKARARDLRVEVHALSLAARDPRVPWYAKVLAACIVAYALSPIDLVPDFIPLLGYLDDLVLIPLGVLVVRRLVPTAVLDDCRARSRAAISEGKPVSWVAAAVIVSIWAAVAVACGRWLLRGHAASP
ncbi:MAG: DUF1232 domain-containing protein [Deltaproteobacteria bacterium]|nr:DUF1232 domain-containing protein [Deltaproteobacteria bacterium]